MYATPYSGFRPVARHKGAYFPFLSGPHQCIGNEFAMLEMRLIVAMVLREFDLELLPGQTIQPRGSLTLRPNGPVRMALRGVACRTHLKNHDSFTTPNPEVLF
jgi:cytochrome P450